MKLCSLLFAFLALVMPGFLHSQNQAQAFTLDDTLRGSITAERAWWDLTFYDLRVAVNPAERTISGSNTIHYRVVEPAQVLQIDLQPPLRIEAAELTLKGDNGGVTEVVASGTPARFHQLLDGEEQVPMEGEATSVSYHAKTRLLELKGAAKLRQGERLFFGERIEYQLEKRLVRAFGNSEAAGDGKRVRLILPAPKNDSAP